MKNNVKSASESARPKVAKQSEIVENVEFLHSSPFAVINTINAICSGKEKQGRKATPDEAAAVRVWLESKGLTREGAKALRVKFEDLFTADFDGMRCPVVLQKIKDDGTTEMYHDGDGTPRVYEIGKARYTIRRAKNSVREIIKSLSDGYKVSKFVEISDGVYAKPCAPAKQKKATRAELEARIAELEAQIAK